ncbi:MAG: hypothetical protein LC650_03985 [Actinobacteria bacterium]|nr:hypothetical protein [Actinomycetota bacterium]
MAHLLRNWSITVHDASTINLAAEVVDILRNEREGNVGGITVRDLQSVTSTLADTTEVIVAVGAVAAELILEELESYDG